MNVIRVLEMLVDCHSHIWSREHITGEFAAAVLKAWGNEDILRQSRPEDHLKAMQSVDKAIVFGFQAKKSGYSIPNEFVADYARKHSGKIIGFASVDPNNLNASKELRKCVKTLGLRGLKLGPIYQHFSVSSAKAMRLFGVANDLEIPIVIHQGTTFVRNAPLKYANPIDIEDVALAYPELKIVIAHLGHPWEDETAVLVRKQPNVFTDISAVHPRPFRMYNKLMTFKEYHVMDKIIFGTDFPFFTPEQTIAGINQVNQFASEHTLPKIDESDIHAIIYDNYARVFGSLM
jgi:hypothetical protein